MIFFWKGLVGILNMNELIRFYGKIESMEILGWFIKLKVY